MLACEGYMMFRGTADVLTQKGSIISINGVWLYRPDMGMWYVNGSELFPWGTSFGKNEIINIKEE